MPRYRPPRATVIRILSLDKIVPDDDTRDAVISLLSSRVSWGGGMQGTR